MAYEFKIEKRPDHLRVEVSGVRKMGDVEDADRVGMQIVQTCQESGIFRILLVLGLSGQLSALDAYEIVSHSEDYGWTHEFRIAFVDSCEQSIRDSAFVETVAVNRAYQVKFFDNEEEATQWLLEAG